MGTAWRWLLCGGLALASAAAGGAVRLLTEDDPPFNYPDGRGGVAGAATEMVAEMFRRAGVDYRIELLPWARAYQQALLETDACLYATTRTAERERRFVWIGPLLQNDWAIFAGPQSPPGGNDIERLRGYRIGGYRGDAVAQYLLDRGFKLDILSDDVLNLRKLMLGRIDFWASGVYHARFLARRERLGPLREVAVFSSSRLYLACQPRMPAAVTGRLAIALASMQRDGFLERIKKRYQATPLWGGS
ncbi:substrate-binding periplasmic protein [Chromobacterium vaccinii]|uniref:substrate-binding periplasmic protein n=1 Tax=Chromobacterium vaccinii TaxID=1108595 RepID=UPI003C76E37B